MWCERLARQFILENTLNLADETSAPQTFRTVSPALQIPNSRSLVGIAILSPAFLPLP